MTSPRRIAMLTRAVAQHEAYVASQTKLAESQAAQLLAAESDAERDALVAHWRHVNSPAQVRARAERLARNRRRRQAAERGARTVPAYGVRAVDMSGFEKQFGGTTP
jgi:hypothetical protein